MIDDDVDDDDDDRPTYVNYAYINATRAYVLHTCTHYIYISIIK
jgi:hypothetical protein